MPSADGPDVTYLLLALDPTDFTVDLVEKHLLAAETSIVAVGASCGTPRTPFFEGCTPSPLLLSIASSAAVDYLRAEEVGAASAPSGRRRSGRGKGGRSVGGGRGGGGGGCGGGGGGGGGGVGSDGGGGGVGGGGGGSSGSGGGGGGGGSGGGGGGSGGGRGGSSQRGGLGVEGDCYLCMPPDPGIEAAALGASESAALGVVASGSLSGFHLPSFSMNSVSISPPTLACPSLPSLCRGAAACRSSLLLVPRTEAPLQTLHLDVWGPARVRGQGNERYFLLVVGEYTRYTTVFPLRRKWEVLDYAAHQLNLWPRVSLPETSPTLRWTGEVGDASVFQVDSVGPVEVAVDSGAARGAASGGAAPAGAGPGSAELKRAEPGVAQSEGAEPGSAEPERAEPGGAQRGGVEPRGAEPGGTEPERAEPWGAGHGGAEPGGVEPERATPGGTLSSGSPPGVLSRRETLSPPELREWFARRSSLHSGAARARAAGGAEAPGPGGARTGGTEAAEGTGAIGAEGAAGAGAAGGAGGAGDGAGGGTGALNAGSRGAERPRPYFFPLLQQVLSPSTDLTSPLLCPPPVQSQPKLQPASPLPAPSPYTEQPGGLTKRREPASRPASPVRAVCTGRRVPRQRPPLVPYTHQMALRPSFVPLRVPLPSPPASSPVDGPDPESDSLRAASPTVMRILATVVTNPSFESTAASALVAELVDFAAVCRLDYAASLVGESDSVCPPSVGGECALGTDVLEDRQEDFECFAAAIPHLVSMLIAPEGDSDAPDIPTPRSYEEAIEGPYSSQWQSAMDVEMASWKSSGTYVDEVPPPWANIVSGMWIFGVKRPPGSPPVLHEASRDYELHSLDFSTAFLQGSLHEEIRLLRPPDFTGSFPPGTQWSLWRPVYGLRQAPSEWHDTLRTTLAALGFAPSTADPSLFLRSDTLLPPFYILVYVDDLVFATADTAGLAHVKSELQKRHTCTDLGAMAAQESRWLTYLLTDLGEAPRSPPIQYVDNKAMIALCQEHKL
ncbi:unnamed protein product [Closterium sp. NIES-65]|nr:unnamed protein product [Closterium sp. NIES-65]